MPSAEPAAAAVSGAVVSGEVVSTAAISGAAATHEVPSSAETSASERHTRELTHSHYENFSVVSFLLPRHLRQDFCNVYAYCRTADDAADEIADQDQSLRALAKIREDLHATYAGRPNGPIFIALSATIQRHGIPIGPFDDLLDAFEQDRRISRYATYAQLVDYCRRSADPVGRLVLWMCGYRDAERQRLSDRTCTALQLANFWQDVKRDLLERDRIYLPAESMDRFGVSEAMLRRQIAEQNCQPAMRRLIQFEVDRAAGLFDEGDALLPMLDRSVRGQVGLFAAGGRAVLASIRRLNFDTLTRRPSLSKWQKGHLITTALLNRLIVAVRPASIMSRPAEAKA